MSHDEQRVVLLTGASSGIGRALAQAWARQGARLVLVARRRKRLEEVAGAVREAGGDALVAPADVRRRDEVGAAVRRALDAWGHIDVAVANAGVGIPTNATRLDVDRIELTMRVNFFGAVYTVAAVLPSMLERKQGWIAGISSLSAWRGFPVNAAYAASKAALSTWLEGIRPELEPHGVGVTIVHPGFVRTPLTEKNRFKMPFLLEPDEAARIIVEGVEARRLVVNFPWQTTALMRIARHLPSRAWDAALRAALQKSL